MTYYYLDCFADYLTDVPIFTYRSTSLDRLMQTAAHLLESPASAVGKVSLGKDSKYPNPRDLDTVN